MANKIAIVGIFFDGYYDIWEDFLKLLSIHWKDCPYDVYIVDGEKDIKFDDCYNAKVIHAGADAEYSKKVRAAIDNIDADYFLLLLEDFFFEKDLEPDILDNIVSLMKKNNISYLRMPMYDFDGKGDKKKHHSTLDSKTSFHYIPTDSEYTVSCQPSLWDKDFLSECIGVGNYNAWIFEGVYTYSKTAHTDAFLAKCRVDYNNILGLRHGAVQGKMLPNVYKDFAKQGYSFRNQRCLLSGFEYYKYIFRQKIADNVPLSILRIMRRMLGKSVVEKYHKEIDEVMEMNNIV